MLATQNPIEQEGTYPLPEAQSRSLHAEGEGRLPERGEEKEILRRAGLAKLPELSAAGDARGRARGARARSRTSTWTTRSRTTSLDLVTATRRPKDVGLATSTTLLAFGASPRATIFMVRGASGARVARRPRLRRCPRT